jgi:hypothetical protein
LKRLDLPDGPTQTICEAPTARGGTWSRKGVIVFAPSSKGGLLRVDASGGVPRPATKTSEEAYSHRWPVFIDDERFLFVAQSQRPAERGVFAASLEGGAYERILPTPLSVAFAAPHHLLYIRDHILVRQRLGRDLQLSGDPEILTDGMVYFVDRGYVPASAAENGAVAFRRNGASIMRLGWYTRDGDRVDTLGDLGEYEGISLSPDGTRVAFGYFDDKESLNHVAIAAVRDGVPRRFTFKRGNQYSPIWAPDGSRLGFSDDFEGVDTLAAKALSGAGEERPLLAAGPGSVYPQAWSPDGAHVLFRVEDPRSGFDVYALPLASGRPFAYLNGPADESQAQFSPDGAYVAYTSTESGRPEVYVQPFPATGAKWQVSAAGGEQPRWRRDGKELFYVAPDRRLRVVPVARPGAFEDGAPAALFATWLPVGDMGISQAYDVTPDGSRFVIASVDPQSPPSPITVVTR